MAAAEIGEDLVRMRPFLPVRLRACTVAYALKQRRHRADRSVGKDSIRRKISRPVVGGK